MDETQRESTKEQKDEHTIFLDATCPNCGSMCGNNRSGEIFYCFQCGWHGEIDMDPWDIELIRETLEKLK